MVQSKKIVVYYLPKFNSEFTPEKVMGKEDDPASYWVLVTFQGRTVKLQEGND